MGRLIFILTFLLACALSGCAGLGGEPNIVLTVLPPTAAPITQSGAWQPDLENGARIFAERCADCHGESGDGQGELVLSGSVSPPLDLTDRAAVSLKSPLEFFQIITEGRLDRLMPPWADALTESERWDVALYSYSLGYDDEQVAAGETIWREACANCDLPALIAPVYSDAAYGEQLNAEQFGGALAADEISAVVAFLRMQSLESAEGKSAGERNESAPAPLGNITGRVKHGSAGGIVPADATVQLQYGNSELGFSLAETNLDAGLRFSFADIPLNEAFRYVVSAVYQGRLFSRQFAASASDVTLELFDVTNDPAALKISRIELVMDAIDLTDLGSGLRISQLIRFENESDRVFTSGRGFDDGREAVLLLRFPRGARAMSGDQNGRYVVIQDMENIPDSVIDTLPVPPGEPHQVLMEYFLPYDSEALIEQAFIYAIDADISVTAPDKLSASSDLLTLERANGGGGWNAYTGRLRLDDQPALRLRISGDPFGTSSGDNMIVTQESLLRLLAGAGGISLVLLAGLSLARRRRGASANETDRLVAELARLDDEHDRGALNHDLYHRRRRELKTRLADLMAEDG